MKDFMEYPVEEVVMQRLSEVRNSLKPELEIIDMFDQGERFGPEVIPLLTEMLSRVLGYVPSVTHYSLFDSSITEGKVGVFSGKFHPFDHKDAQLGLGDAYDSLREYVVNGTDPILALCSGHQLYALMNGAELKFIEPGYAEDPAKKLGMHEMTPTDHAIDHPLLDGFNSTNGLLWNRHNQFVTVPSSARVLFNEGNGVPYVMEHKDPHKHVLTFQSHPEKLFPDGDGFHGEESQQEHAAGLVLLINALYLLSHPTKYVEHKQNYE